MKITTWYCKRDFLNSLSSIEVVFFLILAVSHNMNHVIGFVFRHRSHYPRQVSGFNRYWWLSFSCGEDLWPETFGEFLKNPHIIYAIYRIFSSNWLLEWWGMDPAWINYSCYIDFTQNRQELTVINISWNFNWRWCPLVMKLLISW